MKPFKSVDDIKVGDKVRFYYGSKGNPNNCLYHVRGIVDEEGFVFRFWRKSKQCWGYKTEYKFSVEYFMEHGCVFKG